MEFEEKPETKISLSFLEQLQEQISECRKAISNEELPLTPNVTALESLLWPKIRNDEEYIQTLSFLNQDFLKKKEGLKHLKSHERKYQNQVTLLMRLKAKEQFRAIMIFLDKTKLLPMDK